jgi:hypothetical protein
MRSLVLLAHVVPVGCWLPARRARFDRLLQELPGQTAELNEVLGAMDSCFAILFPHESEWEGHAAAAAAAAVEGKSAASGDAAGPDSKVDRGSSQSADAAAVDGQVD